MDQETKDRLFQLLTERVESLERSIQLMNTLLIALETAVGNHQKIFEAVSAGAGQPAPD